MPGPPELQELARVLAVDSVQQCLQDSDSFTHELCASGFEA